MSQGFLLREIKHEKQSMKEQTIFCEIESRLLSLKICVKI